MSSRSSSAGWAKRIGADASTDVTTEDEVGDDVTRPGRCYLLRAGWRRQGLLDPNAVPGNDP